MTDPGDKGTEGSTKETLRKVALHRDHLEGNAEAAVNDIRKWAGRIKAQTDDEEIMKAAMNLQRVAGYLEAAVDKPKVEVNTDG